MPRSFKAILACVFLVSFLAIGFGAAPVYATTYELFADAIWDPQADFSMRVGDAWITEHRDIALKDVVPNTFTGFGADFDVLLWLPVIAWTQKDIWPWQGIAGGDDQAWFFASTKYPNPLGWPDWPYYPQTYLAPYAKEFTYTLSQSPVPLPPSVFLLGAGLIGLAGWRRLRKS